VSHTPAQLEKIDEQASRRQPWEPDPIDESEETAPALGLPQVQELPEFERIVMLALYWGDVPISHLPGLMRTNFKRVHRAVTRAKRELATKCAPGAAR
jgi:hypothetical protein